MAEQWTASELRALRRHGWIVINHVTLSRWDIDHVLIGPSGIVAVETKWSANGWHLETAPDQLRVAVDRTADNIRQLRLWTPLKAAGITEIRGSISL